MLERLMNFLTSLVPQRFFQGTDQDLQERCQDVDR